MKYEEIKNILMWCIPTSTITWRRYQQGTTYLKRCGLPKKSVSEGVSSLASYSILFGQEFLRPPIFRNSSGRSRGIKYANRRKPICWFEGTPYPLLGFACKALRPLRYAVRCFWRPVRLDQSFHLCAKRWLPYMEKREIIGISTRSSQIIQRRCDSLK